MYFPSIFNLNPMKNHLIICVFFLHLIMFFNVIKAQTPPNQYDLGNSQDVVSSFQPSLAVVIGILSIMFSLTFILVLYAKFCHRSTSSSPVHNQLQIQDGLLRSRSRSSGIDKTVIESLPFFRFSSLKGSREGLECAICLSKFEDIEILRFLPKCKHAFHINCLDQWLEKHSSCPLCRNMVRADDLTTFTYSNSLRFLWNNHSEMRDESDVEFYIQREESRRGSSRFSITSSFRKTEKHEEELPIQQSDDHEEDDKKGLHKLNHRIIVSDVVLKNRWSNVSSSDLMFLNSEMIHQISSNRFSDLEDPSSTETKLTKIKQNEFYQTPYVHPNSSSTKTKGFSENPSKILNSSDKRSMSEIIVHPRFQDFKNCNNNREHNSLPENAAKEERIRRIWLPIARRTVQWFANRERRSSSDDSHNSRQPSNV